MLTFQCIYFQSLCRNAHSVFPIFNFSKGMNSLEICILHLMSWNILLEQFFMDAWSSNIVMYLGLFNQLSQLLIASTFLIPWTMLRCTFLQGMCNWFPWYNLVAEFIMFFIRCVHILWTSQHPPGISRMWLSPTAFPLSKSQPMWAHQGTTCYRWESSLLPFQKAARFPV